MGKQLLPPGTRVRVLVDKGQRFTVGIVKAPDRNTMSDEIIVAEEGEDDGWYFKTGEYEIIGYSEPRNESSDDPVNPRHYADLGQFAAIYIIEKWGLDFNLGQVLKYIQRAGHKPGESELTDLEKAAWYLQRKLHELDPEKHKDPAA